VDVRVEEDSPLVEELWWLHEFAAGHALVWHNVGDNTQLGDLLSVSLIGGGGVALCCVRLFVWVYASACYVRMLLFLI
jgi:hypothetical protein